MLHIYAKCVMSSVRSVMPCVVTKCVLKWKKSVVSLMPRTFTHDITHFTQMRGTGETTDFYHIQTHYFTAHDISDVTHGVTHFTQMHGTGETTDFYHIQTH